MDEDLIKAFEEAYAKGNQDLLISNLKFAGYTDDEINGAVSSFKKKREDSSASGFPSEEEYFALDISENKPRGSSVKLFNAIARGNMTPSEIEKDPEYYNGLYNIYRAYSNDPAVQQLPDALFTEAGEVDSAAFGRLKRDAYRNVQYQIEKDRKDFQEREGKIKERQESYVSVVSPIINGAESILGGVVKFVGEASGFEPATELGDYLLEDVELSSIAGMRNSGLTDEQISKGFLQNMADGDVGVGLSILGPQLLQQVPQLALIAATGGTAGITTLGVSSAGSALREVEDRTDMTSQEKMLYGVGSGIVEGLSERLFAGDIRALRRALGKSDIRQLTTSEFKDRLFSAVPAGVRSTLEEGFEEAVASAAQQTILNFMTGDPIDPIEITEGAIIGSLMGGGTYLASRGIGAVVEPETEKKKRKLNKEIQNLKEKEEDPTIPQDQKGIVKEKREALQNELGDLYSSTDEVAKYMSEKNVEDFKKFRGLQLEIKRAMNEFRTIEDEDISNIQKEKIQNLYNQASEIYKKYASEKEAGVPSPVEEGAPAVQPEPVEVPSPEAPAPSGVLQAPEEEVKPQAVEEAPEAVAPAKREPADALSDVSSEAKRYRDERSKLTLDEDLSKKGSELRSSFIDSVVAKFNPGETVSFSYVIPKDEAGTARDKKMDVRLEFYEKDGRTEFKAYINGAPRGSSDTERTRKGTYGSRFAGAIGWPLSMVGTSETSIELSGVKAPEAVAPVEEKPELKAAQLESNKQFQEEKKRLQDEIVRLQDTQINEISRVRQAIREVQGTNKLAMLDGAFVNEGTIDRINAYYEPLITNLEKDLSDLLKQSKPAEEAPKKEEPTVSYLGKAYTTEKGETHLVEAQFTAPDGTFTYKVRVDPVTPALGKRKIIDLTANQLEEKITSGEYTERAARIPIVINGGYTAELPADTAKRLGFGKDDVYVVVDTGVTKRTKERKIKLKNITKNIGTEFSESDFYKYFNPTGQQYEFNTKTLDYEPKKDKSEPADWVKYSQEGFPAISVADVKRLFPNAANVVLANGKKISQYNDTTLLSAKDVRNLIAKGNSFSYKDKASIDDVTAKLIDLEKINAVLSPLDKRTFAASKKEVIDKINSSRSYSKEQKEILTSLIGTIKGDVLFNFLRPSETALGLEGASNFYNFGKNVLKAKNAPSLVHEIGHWGFYNILSPEDRIEFLRYARDRFKEDVNGERQLAETVSSYRSEKGLGSITHSNANENYQEYFATQFTQWMYNEQYAVSEIRTLFEKILDFVKDYLRILKDKKYNPDLVKYFEKIVQRKEAEIAGEVIDKDDVQEFADEKDSKGDTNVKFNGKKSFIERAVSSIVNQAWTKDQRVVRMFKTNMTSQVNNERRKIINQSKRLDTLLKNADPETLELTRLLMTDGIKDNQLDALARKPNGKAIITQASAMRAYIDSFSEDFISNPAFYRLSPELAITIINNMGSYMRNSYRFWKDDRYEPSERAISEAVAYEFQVLQQMRGTQIAKLFEIEKTREELSEASIDLSIINERIRLIEDEVRAGEISQADAKKELENLRDAQKEIEDKVISLTKLSGNQSALFNELMGDVPMDGGNIAKYQAQQRDYTEKILSQESEEIKKKAEESIQLYLDEIQKIRSGERFKKLGEISPSSIKLPSQEFRQRKSLPDTIKNVLGKETDPIIVFSDTANALSSIKYKGHMLYAISQSLGGDEKYIKNEATEAEKVSGEFRMVTDRFSPLNGRYVHKDIFEALVDPRIYEGNQWWSDIYFKTLLAARKSKVIYNLPTWRKNLTGGWYTIMANGVVNASFISDMQNRAKLMIKGEVDPETEQLIDLAAKYGLMGQSVNANLMGFIDVMYSRANNDGDYRNAYEKVSDAIAGFDQMAGGLYASVDDYTKLIVFRSELDSQAGKLYGKKFDELTKAEKEKAAFEAAELVKKTTPTFSKLPKWYSKIAVLPLGDFVSFELEALRSFGMNIYEGNKDIVKALKDKSLSKEQKAAHIKAGTARLMGSASIAGLRLSIVAALASAALGDDDELIEDIGAARPNWMEGHSIIPVKISKDGIATVYDYSMEDPYGSFFDLVRDPGSFPEYVTDLLSLNMGVTFLTRLAENKDVYGRDIVESYDDLQTKAYKYTEHTLKSLIIPPFASSAYRDERRRAEVEADEYSPLDAVARFASRAIIRDYQYNVGTQFYYFSDQFRTKGKVQYIDLEGSARENRLAELSEIKRMYDAIANIAIQKENMKLLYDARQSVKRKFKAAEEAYILSGYEVPEE